METNRFHTAIAGVTHDNDDGSSRQEILRKCTIGERLILEHFPLTDHPNAVKILKTNGEMLGWIRSYVAEGIVEFLNSGGTVRAVITELTGGTTDKKTLGCNIEVIESSNEDNKEVEYVTEKQPDNFSIGNYISKNLGRIVLYGFLLIVVIVLLVTCFR